MRINSIVVYRVDQTVVLSALSVFYLKLSCKWWQIRSSWSFWKVLNERLIKHLKRFKSFRFIFEFWWFSQVWCHFKTFWTFSWLTISTFTTSITGLFSLSDFLKEPLMCICTMSLLCSVCEFTLWQPTLLKELFVLFLWHVIVSCVRLRSTTYCVLLPHLTKACHQPLYWARPLPWSLPCFIEAWQFILKPTVWAC